MAGFVVRDWQSEDLLDGEECDTRPRFRSVELLGLFKRAWRTIGAKRNLDKLSSRLDALTDTNKYVSLEDMMITRLIRSEKGFEEAKSIRRLRAGSNKRSRHYQIRKMEPRPRLTAIELTAS